MVLGMYHCFFERLLSHQSETDSIVCDRFTFIQGLSILEHRSDICHSFIKKVKHLYFSLMSWGLNRKIYNDIYYVHDCQKDHQINIYWAIPTISSWSSDLSLKLVHYSLWYKFIFLFWTLVVSWSWRFLRKYESGSSWILWRATLRL